jgi:imidazole glycerol-phosphate synthase subunit HisF
MQNFRVIPVLLYKGRGLYKSVKFDQYKYVGDPINAVKIFNDKEVDELIFLDIDPAKRNTEPDYELIKEIATECFMPVCYGGRVTTIDQIRKILSLGIEKVSINKRAVTDPLFIKQASEEFGASTIVVSIDVKKNFWNKYEVYTDNGNQNAKTDPFTLAKKMEEMGAGEILINSIDRDGMMQGYDLELLSKLTLTASVPIIACGGASTMEDFSKAIHCGASAVAAGSMFVFHGKHKAVLINYPSQSELKLLFSKNETRV